MDNILWTILIAVVLSIILLLVKKHSDPLEVSPQVLANRKLGLPDNFTPPEYLGPARAETAIYTAKGIEVSAFGFDLGDIPILKVSPPHSPDFSRRLGGADANVAHNNNNEKIQITA